MLNSKTRHVWGAVTVAGESVKQVISVGTYFGVGIGKQEIQTIAKLLFQFCLQTVVVAASLSYGIACTSSKIREWFEQVSICIRGQDLAHLVRTGEDLQMAGQGSHVAGLECQRRSQLILQREIPAHRIRCLIIKLNSTQLQIVGIYRQWVERYACKPSPDVRAINRRRRTRRA